MRQENLSSQNKLLVLTCGNISVGKEAQFERLAISIKFVTAERKAFPNAARKYTAAVSYHFKNEKL
jgi:hypothetical protein